MPADFSKILYIDFPILFTQKKALKRYSMDLSFMKYL